MIKVLGAETSFFKVVHNSGHIRNGWSDSVFVTLPIKTTTKMCADYKTICSFGESLTKARFFSR